MSTLLLTGQVMNPDEVLAYRQGERACLEGLGFFSMEYSYDPHGTNADNALVYAYIDGFFDTEKRLDRERAEARITATLEVMEAT